MKRQIAALCFSALFWASPSLAKDDEVYPEVITNQGFAFSDEDEKTNVVTVFDPVSVVRNRVEIADCAKYRIVHKNVTWCFASAAHKSLFAKQSSNRSGNMYVPFLGCRCAYGVSNGKITPEGDPRTAIRIRFGERPQDVVTVCNGSVSVRTNFLGRAELRMHSALNNWQSWIEGGRIVPNQVETR